MKRWMQVIVAAAIVALGFGIASSVLAVTAREWTSCKDSNGWDSYGREKCCEIYGGGWVNIYDSKGHWIDGYCAGIEDTTLSSEGSAPTPTPAPTRTTTGTTSGTYTAPTASPRPTTTTSGSTSGTYSR